MHIWENNTKFTFFKFEWFEKIYLKEFDWYDKDWIDLAQDRNKREVFVKTVMNIRVP